MDCILYINFLIQFWSVREKDWTHVSVERTMFIILGFSLIFFILFVVIIILIIMLKWDQDMPRESETSPSELN